MLSNESLYELIHGVADGPTQQVAEVEIRTLRTQLAKAQAECAAMRDAAQDALPLLRGYNGNTPDDRWGPKVEKALKQALSGTAGRDLLAQLTACQEALRELIPRFKKCLIHGGTNPEFADAAVAKAEAALKEKP